MQDLDFKTDENISLSPVNEGVSFLVINKNYTDFLKIKETIINQVKNYDNNISFTCNGDTIIGKIYIFSEKQNDKWLDFREIIENNFNENACISILKKIRFNSLEKTITDLQLHNGDTFPNESIVFEININK